MFNRGDTFNLDGVVYRVGDVTPSFVFASKMNGEKAAKGRPSKFVRAELASKGMEFVQNVDSDPVSKPRKAAVVTEPVEAVATAEAVEVPADSVPADMAVNESPVYDTPVIGENIVNLSQTIASGLKNLLNLH